GPGEFGGRERQRHLRSGAISLLLSQDRPTEPCPPRDDAASRPPYRSTLPSHQQQCHPEPRFELPEHPIESAPLLQHTHRAPASPLALQRTLRQKKPVPSRCPPPQPLPSEPTARHCASPPPTRGRRLRASGPFPSAFPIAHRGSEPACRDPTSTHLRALF